ncbi:DNA-processing protein DprA [Desulfatibacillum aliphaticivorans]|uniref:DNA-processing protein DprA n=1 Tax=Desulfatibacillum aliphaticivorans TaxID=218208 RepID=UPI0004085919|nr:DNA-processing protein DprA [Desulfatibacillum aliphaticivorans]
MNTEILQFLLGKGAGEAALSKLCRLAAQEGHSHAISVCNSPKRLIAELGLKPSVADNVINARPDAMQLANELERKSIEVLWIGGPHYPERLNTIMGKASPPVLFIQGNRNLLDDKSVGFCGSRKASDKGIRITEQCSQQLVEKGFCVVSGYAHGVDMAAHKTALECGGTTIIVLVEGILRFQEKAPVKNLLSNGNHLIISQFSPRITWNGGNAMKRNGTIIGLSDAMILVESGSKGGTFAAGEETLKYNRPLFVIHYAEPGPSAEANEYFMQKGGIPVRGNREGIPNLKNVLEIAEQQSWRFYSNNSDLNQEQKHLPFDA